MWLAPSNDKSCFLHTLTQYRMHHISIIVKDMIVKDMTACRQNNIVCIHACRVCISFIMNHVKDINAVQRHPYQVCMLNTKIMQALLGVTSGTCTFIY